MSFRLQGDCTRWGLLFPPDWRRKSNLKEVGYFSQVSQLANVPRTCAYSSILCCFLGQGRPSRNIRHPGQNQNEGSSVVLSVHKACCGPYVRGVTVSANCMVLADPRRVLINKTVNSGMARLKSIPKVKTKDET